MNAFILTCIQALVVCALAPFTLGLVRMVKARLQGRHGASPFLMYVSFATLLRKQMVVASHTSYIFRLVPYLVLASAVFLAVTLPLVGTGGALAGMSNLFLIAGVLVIGAVFLVFGGLESSSAFGGMGASREMTVTALIEPAMIVTLATLAVVTGSGTLNGALAAHPTVFGTPFLLLTIAALVLVALTENARYPVDNPATHLELTMVHEAMILEYSGPYLAMLEYAAALKLTVFALLVANVLVPYGLWVPQAGMMALAVAVGATVLKVIVAMVAVALLESVLAKMRFYRMDEFASSAFFLGLGGLLLAVLHLAI